MAVDLEDDVAGLDAGLVAGAVAFDHPDQRAVRAIESERIGELCIDFLNRHADAAACDLAVRDQLILHIAGNIDRHRERQAHVAARAAVDLRIDADDFALEIEQRTTGIAGVHRDVGLDERRVVAASPGIEREVALTTPAVTLFSKPNGEPMAMTHSPGLSFDASPRRTVGRFLASILSTATSVRSIDADHLRFVLAPVGHSYRDLDAPSTTCAFVRM